MLDVLIGGAGIAGCALAIHLRRHGLRVLIVGRSPAARLVGEHLPPHARPLLTDLGLWENFLADGHVRCPGICSAWGSAQLERRDFIFTPFGDGWNLDRARFDRRLVQTARQAGAEVHTDAAVVALGRSTSGWQVEILHDGSRETHGCRVVVDATGRASALARKLGSRRATYDGLVAVAGWLEGATGPRDHTLLLEAVPHGWWYSAALPQNTQIAAFLTGAPLPVASRQEVQTLWREQLARTEHIRTRLAGCTPLGETEVRPANTYCMEPLSGENWLAVGDAAAALDPISSMGILRALTSARWAADAIQGHLRDDAAALDHYTITLQRDFQEQLTTRTQVYRQEQRWADQPFWRSCHAASNAGGVEEHPAHGDGGGVAVVGRTRGIARRLPGDGST